MRQLLAMFDAMAGEYGFHVVDTADSIQNVSEQIKAIVEPLLVRA